MANLKHVGRIKTNKRRAIVAYRTLPNDPYNALVVMTEGLPADEHDTLIRLVESPAGQQAEELALAMSRTYLPDGRNMLAGFHTTGQLKKVPTNMVEMTPNNQSSILLSDLNEVIAQQKGVAIEDLAIKSPTGNATPPAKPEPTVEEDPASIYLNNPSTEQVSAPVQQGTGVLTDEDLAAQYRSQADAMFKEAKRLREQAEELAPTKKRTTKKSVEEAN